MAGHVQDRWYKTEKGSDGNLRRVRSDRFGMGLRYRARYVGPDGTEKSQSFPDRQKRKAEDWLREIEADMSRGQFIDPKAARVTFRQYAEKWLETQTTDVNTQASVSTQVRRHAIPYLGMRPMDSFESKHIREWLSQLSKAVVAESYRAVIFRSVFAIFNAAVEDRLRTTNPCRSRTITVPGRSKPRIRPWSKGRAAAVRNALPDRYRAMVDVGAGEGLRQGEIFGLPEDEIDFAAGWLHVRYQVKDVGGHLVFAPPKGGKERDVPLAGAVGESIKAHLTQFPAVDVTLPWKTTDGPLVTKRLVFTTDDGKALNRSVFNRYVWKPALAAAGALPPREPGKPYRASREDGVHALRHLFASLVLAGGGNIKMLSVYLGHSDPGFTLRIYVHLMPDSDEQTRRAVDGAFRDGPWTADGP